MKGISYGGETLSGSMGLPQDAVRGETLLAIVGTSAVQIENYRSILLYSDTCVRIQARHYRLVINGRNLMIRYYDRDEMKVTGRIDSIAFE